MDWSIYPIRWPMKRSDPWTIRFSETLEVPNPSEFPTSQARRRGTLEEDCQPNRKPEPVRLQ